MINTKVEKIKEHLEEIMKILELPITKSNKDTPLRIAKMWCNELFVNRNDRNIEELDDRMTLFPNDYSSKMVIVKDIDFHSTCEHHWLPFSGKVSVGYVPTHDIIGLSKIPRIVKYFSAKPQLQEKLTTEIGLYIAKVTNARAVFVEVEATHQCVACRGAESNCSTITYFKYSPNFEGSDDGNEYYEEFKSRIRGGK